MAKVREVLRFLQKKMGQQCHMSSLSLQSEVTPSSHVIYNNSIKTQEETTNISYPASLQMSDIPGPRSFPGIGAMWQYLPGGKSFNVGSYMIYSS